MNEIVGWLFWISKVVKKKRTDCSRRKKRVQYILFRYQRSSGRGKMESSAVDVVVQVVACQG